MLVQKHTLKKQVTTIVLIIVLTIITLLICWVYIFEVNKLDDPLELTITPGSSLSEVYNVIEPSELAPNYLYYRSYAVLNNFQPKAGTYRFRAGDNLGYVLESIDNHSSLAPAAKLVIPEGFNNRKVITALAELVDSQELKMDIAKFSELISDKEGYIFPDTYFIETDTTADQLVDQMLQNFNQKTAVFKPELTRDEVIVASIIEREVIDPNDRRLVSDIVWRRLEMGMRLQVDATLDYYLDKPSSEILQSELDEDNPYNTYRNYGLPPTPIANPSIGSLEAARNPQANEYLFYLSAADGTTIFATNFEEHVRNKAIYL
jgi:UPF0755 protein